MKLFDRIVVFNTVLVAVVFGLSFVRLPQMPEVAIEKPNLETPELPKFQFPEVAFSFELPEIDNSDVGVIAGVADEQPEPTATPIPPTATPTPIPIANPVKVDIPSLQVTANIVNVGVTDDNVMEIPTDYSTVGWYYPGGKPGEEGSAILNGHFDNPTGQPAVFYNLRDLERGSDIIVTAEDGKEYTFIVEDVYSHPLDEFPTDLLYGDDEGTTLKLLTCDGVWSPYQQNYSNRLVVIAKIAE